MNTPSLDIAVKGWVDHVDRRHGFALSHPSDWRATRGISGLLVSLVAPDQPDPSFRPNLNVVRRVRDSALDLDGLAETVLSTLARLLTDILVVDVDSAVVGDVPARRLLVAYRQGIYALTSEQWVFMTDEHVWTVSAGAAAEGWAEVADTFGEVVRSFRWDVG